MSFYNGKCKVHKSLVGQEEMCVGSFLSLELPLVIKVVSFWHDTKITSLHKQMCYMILKSVSHLWCKCEECLSFSEEDFSDLFDEVISQPISEKSIEMKKQKNKELDLDQAP
jgi:hypothetical protein